AAFEQTIDEEYQRQVEEMAADPETRQGAEGAVTSLENNLELIDPELNADLRSMLETLGYDDLVERMDNAILSHRAPEWTALPMEMRSLVAKAQFTRLSRDETRTLESMQKLWQDKVGFDIVLPIDPNNLTN